MRKVVLGGVGAALVAALVVVLLIVTGSDDPEDEGDRNARDRARHLSDTVYRTKDVVTAVAGEDYEVVRKIPGEIAHKAELMLPDGAFVLQDRYRREHDPATDRIYAPDRIEIWNPSTDEREPLPILWTVRDQWSAGGPELTTTSGTDLWVSWNHVDHGTRLRRLLHYDRTTGTHEVYTAPRVPRAKNDHWLGRLQPGGDGRLYFMTGSNPCYRDPCPEVHDRELWSFHPDRPGRVRREGTGGTADLAISSTLVAFIEEETDPGSNTLRIRALGDDETHELRIPDCYPPSLVVTERYVLSSCGVLYDRNAEPVAEFNIQSHGLFGISERWVAFGRTVYDTETGRLLRIAEERFWHDRRVVIADDLVLFPTGTEPPNTRNGTWTLARLLPR